jgi:hypothetical protein
MGWHIYGRWIFWGRGCTPREFLKAQVVLLSGFEFSERGKLLRFKEEVLNPHPPACDETCDETCDNGMAVTTNNN